MDVSRNIDSMVYKLTTTSICNLHLRQFRVSIPHLCLESLGNSLPVDDIPNCAEVLGLSVLILQVVGVLPGIDTKQRN